MSARPVLRKHSYSHHPELKVDENVFSSRFAKGCAMSNCRGNCCGLGVDMDLAERERILEHTELVQSLMDESQERNPANWFGEQTADPDYPSGRAIATTVHNGGCVFLNEKKLCVLQIAEAHTPPGVKYLKPFFCRAFPMCIDNGALVVDECPDETRCCAPVGKGALTIFDICAFELEYVLGAAGVDELRQLASEPTESSS